jgi:hypothetical protein
MQTKKMSMLETTLNVGSGVILAWAMAYWLLPLWGYAYTGTQALTITLVFTGVSWIRTYMWRRFFSRSAIFSKSAIRRMS